MSGENLELASTWSFPKLEQELLSCGIAQKIIDTLKGISFFIHFDPPWFTIYGMCDFWWDFICFFLTENEIDSSSLSELSKEDFLQLGFKLGPVLNLLKVIKKLYAPSQTESSGGSNASTTANNSSEPMHFHSSKGSLSSGESSGPLSSDESNGSESSAGRSDSTSLTDSEPSSGGGSSDEEQFQSEAEVSVILLPVLSNLCSFILLIT